MWDIQQKATKEQTKQTNKKPNTETATKRWLPEETGVGRMKTAEGQTQGGGRSPDAGSCACTGVC